MRYGARHGKGPGSRGFLVRQSSSGVDVLGPTTAGKERVIRTAVVLIGAPGSGAPWFLRGHAACLPQRAPDVLWLDQIGRLLGGLGETEKSSVERAGEDRRCSVIDFPRRADEVGDALLKERFG